MSRADFFLWLHCQYLKEGTSLSFVSLALAHIHTLTHTHTHSKYLEHSCTLRAKSELPEGLRRLCGLPHSSQVSKCLDSDPGSPGPRLDLLPAKDKERLACALSLPLGTCWGKPVAGQALCPNNLVVFIIPQGHLASPEFLSAQPCTRPRTSPDSPAGEAELSSFDNARN